MLFLNIQYNLSWRLFQANFQVILRKSLSVAVRRGLVLLQGSKLHTPAKNVLKASPQLARKIKALVAGFPGVIPIKMTGVHVGQFSQHP